ncbi:RNA polymerase sigma factor [Actinokineospora enzanensis]|uniref:RNA polymerase sigma factor n=1 Tax=Actinokineospora enzanensis TaxID=155975 RepID=UPI000379FD4C|nr:RNA polymerase sigma factor [Actinokineospora enzanensis]
MDVRRAVEAVWRLEAAKVVGALTRLVRDVGLAEELAHDTLVAALEQWPESGISDNPGAWLTAVAKRRAVDHLRRAERLARKQEELAREPESAPAEAPDDVLRLMFLSCHPVLPTRERVALTLRLVGGLTVEEIARAFLVDPPVIARRVAAAKRALAGVGFDLPADPAERLSSVLEVVYLVFNEGYSATSGDDLLRPGLCLEALRLGRLLADLVPDAAEAHGLVALMEIQASRSAARTGPSGEPVQLHEQNRGRWDPLLIRRGFTALLRAREIGGPPGPYVLQAAIAVCHARASRAEDTDWAQIAALYEALARQVPTPVVRLNQAVAVGMAHGPAAGLALVDTLADDPALREYHLLPGVRGDLLVRLGRTVDARREFERAAGLTVNAAERAFLLRRADDLAADETAGPTLGATADAFLARDDLGPDTLRSYGQTLRRLRLTVGERVPLSAMTAAEVHRAFRSAWGTASPKTWNRHRSALRMFALWADAAHLADDLPRLAETGAPTESIPDDRLAALFDRDLPVRERVLWLLLRESAAPVRAVLSLDIEDLDLDDRRARTGSGWIAWRAGTARLLPALLGARTRGPVFVTERRSTNARDRCPDTGHTRLSYERAEYLFKQSTKALHPNGYTLRQLRPRET